jgi:hypothetical protein
MSIVAEAKHHQYIRMENCEAWIISKQQLWYAATGAYILWYLYDVSYDLLFNLLSYELIFLPLRSWQPLLFLHFRYCRVFQITILMLKMRLLKEHSCRVGAFSTIGQSWLKTWSTAGTSMVPSPARITSCRQHIECYWTCVNLSTSNSLPAVCFILNGRDCFGKLVAHMCPRALCMFSRCTLMSFSTLFLRTALNEWVWQFWSHNSVLNGYLPWT